MWLPLREQADMSIAKWQSIWTGCTGYSDPVRPCLSNPSVSSLTKMPNWEKNSSFSSPILVFQQSFNTTICTLKRFFTAVKYVQVNKQGKQFIPRWLWLTLWLSIHLSCWHSWAVGELLDRRACFPSDQEIREIRGPTGTRQQIKQGGYPWSDTWSHFKGRERPLISSHLIRICQG